jgi:hypothetical protein
VLVPLPRNVTFIEDVFTRSRGDAEKNTEAPPRLCASA